MAMKLALFCMKNTVFLSELYIRYINVYLADVFVVCYEVTRNF